MARRVMPGVLGAVPGRQGVAPPSGLGGAERGRHPVARVDRLIDPVSQQMGDPSRMADRPLESTGVKIPLDHVHGIIQQGHRGPIERRPDREGRAGDQLGPALAVGRLLDDRGPCQVFQLLERRLGLACFASCVEGEGHERQLPSAIDGPRRLGGFDGADQLVELASFDGGGNQVERGGVERGGNPAFRSIIRIGSGVRPVGRAELADQADRGMVVAGEDPGEQAGVALGRRELSCGPGDIAGREAESLFADHRGPGPASRPVAPGVGSGKGIRQLLRGQLFGPIAPEDQVAGSGGRRRLIVIEAEDPVIVGVEVPLEKRACR